MAGAPRVSIVIPAYNAESFIAGSVRSALAQTVRDIEVVVVDDCSRDGTVTQVRQLAAEDLRVRLVQATRNLGPAGARNLGFRSAAGDWIAILDADDAYAPTRIETLLHQAQAEGADMVADNLLLLEEGEREGRPMLPPSLLPGPRRVDAAAFVEGNIPIRGHPRVSYGFLKPMFRRKFLTDHHLAYDEQVRFAEDFLFYANCLLAGAHFWLRPEALYTYRIRGDSLTASHGAPELRQLYDAGRALLARPDVRGNARTRTALRRHVGSVEERLAWRLFTDGIKQRQPLTTLSAFLSPRSALHIARECALFLPKIPAKLTRLRRSGQAVPT